MEHRGGIVVEDDDGIGQHAKRLFPGPFRVVEHAFLVVIAKTRFDPRRPASQVDRRGDGRVGGLEVLLHVQHREPQAFRHVIEAMRRSVFGKIVPQRQVDRQQVVKRVLVLDTIQTPENDASFGLLSLLVRDPQLGSQEIEKLAAHGRVETFLREEASSRFRRSRTLSPTDQTTWSRAVCLKDRSGRGRLFSCRRRGKSRNGCRRMAGREPQDRRLDSAAPTRVEPLPRLRPARRCSSATVIGHAQADQRIRVVRLPARDALPVRKPDRAEEPHRAACGGRHTLSLEPGSGQSPDLREGAVAGVDLQLGPVRAGGAGVVEAEA